MTGRSRSLVFGAGPWRVSTSGFVSFHDVTHQIQNPDDFSAVLEGLLLNGERGSSAPPNNAAPNMQGCVYHAALLIANSVKGAAEGSNESLPLGQGTYDCQRAYPFPHDTHTAYKSCEGNAAKRRRIDDSECTTRVDRLDSLPGRHALDKIVKEYFAKIHPWLPCVHQPTFEGRLKNLAHDEKLAILVHSMVCVTLKHIELDELGMEESERHSQIQLSRDMVIRMAMADLSVESLQAMIIIASDRVSIFSSALFSSRAVA